MEVTEPEIALWWKPFSPQVLSLLDQKKFQNRKSFIIFKCTRLKIKWNSEISLSFSFCFQVYAEPEIAKLMLGYKITKFQFYLIELFMLSRLFCVVKIIKLTRLKLYIYFFPLLSKLWKQNAKITKIGIYILKINNQKNFPDIQLLFGHFLWCHIDFSDYFLFFITFFMNLFGQIYNVRS